MPVLTVVVTHATGDVFPAADWNAYVRDDINYLIQPGAALVSAGAVTITNQFHQITGTTTISTITATAPVQGQELLLWFAAALTVDGATGNIRLITGTRKVRANTILRLVYDGANWREQAPMGGARIAYAKVTATVSTTGSTFATGADVLASALSFVADGVSDYFFIVTARSMTHTLAGAAAIINLNLDGADQGNMGQVIMANAGVGSVMCGVAIIQAPVAGLHTVNARLYGTAGGTASVVAGVGGAGGDQPITASLEVA